MGVQDVSMRRMSNTTEGIAITASSSTSAVIVNNLHEHIGIIFTTLTTGVSFTVYVSSDGVTFYALNTSADAAVGLAAITTAKAYLLPADCKPFPYLKIVLNAGTATATICRKA